MNQNLVPYETPALYVTCPRCQSSLTVSHPGRIECPTCAHALDVSAPVPTPVAAYVAPQMANVVRPRKIRETNGLGLFLEVVGVLLCFTVVGIILGIPLLIAGGRMSYALLCGSCGHKIESKAVTMCHVCKCTLGKPMRGGISFISIAVWGLVALMFGPFIIWRLYSLWR